MVQNCDTATEQNLLGETCCLVVCICLAMGVYFASNGKAFLSISNHIILLFFSPSFFFIWKTAKTLASLHQIQTRQVVSRPRQDFKWLYGNWYQQNDLRPKLYFVNILLILKHNIYAFFGVPYDTMIFHLLRYIENEDVTLSPRKRVSRYDPSVVIPNKIDWM